MLEIYENLDLNDLVIGTEVEQWTQVSEIDGLEMFKDYYYVSNFGRVKSIGGKFGDRIMRQGDCKGYLLVCLQTSDNKPKMMRVNRLVAFAFVSGYEDGLVCNHLDERKENNHYLNLEWCTIAENNAYGTRTERTSKAVIGTCVKTGKIIKFPSTKEAGRKGFRSGNISKACRGKLNPHCKHGGTNIYRGYKWKYEEAEENDND